MAVLAEFRASSERWQGAVISHGSILERHPVHTENGDGSQFYVVAEEIDAY